MHDPLQHYAHAELTIQWHCWRAPFLQNKMHWHAHAALCTIVLCKFVQQHAHAGLLCNAKPIAGLYKYCLLLVCPAGIEHIRHEGFSIVALGFSKALLGPYLSAAADNKPKDSAFDSKPDFSMNVKVTPFFSSSVSCPACSSLESRRSCCTLQHEWCQCNVATAKPASTTVNQQHTLPAAKGLCCQGIWA
jgi:hypothetical protein